MTFFFLFFWSYFIVFVPFFVFLTSIHSVALMTSVSQELGLVSFHFHSCFLKRRFLPNSDHNIPLGDVEGGLVIDCSMSGPLARGIQGLLARSTPGREIGEFSVNKVGQWKPGCHLIVISS